MGVTIKDIAKAANVSIATVSRVINNKDEGVGEDTREKIKEIMKEMNYTPSAVARGLVTKKTNTLGLMVPDISNPFFPAIVKGVEDTSRKYGYNIILCNSDDNTEKEIDNIRVFKENCVDGIIYIGANKSGHAGLDMLKKSKIPFVYIDRICGDIECSNIYTDGKLGMNLIVEHLIENGHTNIAYIKAAENGDRFEGYKKALKDHGIKLNRALVITGDFRIKSGEEAIYKLLKKNKEFTAIACENDLMAVGAIEGLKNNNISVPGDVSVTGYDDIYISNLISPKLTTIHQDTYEMGKKSVEILIELISKKEEVHETTILIPKIIIRESVKNIK